MDRGTLMAVIDTKFDLVGASYFSWKTHDVKSVVWERWDETSAQEIAFQERSPRKIIPIEVHGAISIDSLSRGSLSRAINFKSQGKQRSSIQRVKLFQTSLTNLSRVLNFRAKGRKVCYESRYERAGQLHWNTQVLTLLKQPLFSEQFNDVGQSSTPVVPLSRDVVDCANSAERRTTIRVEYLTRVNIIKRHKPSSCRCERRESSLREYEQNGRRIVSERAWHI